MNRLWMAPLSLGLLCSSYSYAAAVENGYPQGMRPAILTLGGESATIVTEGNKQYLSINNVHPLIMMVSSLGKHREFKAFSTKAYADSWNTCNDMKDKINLWHRDGHNAYITYGDGPENGQKSKYQTNSPLYTSKDATNPNYTTGQMGAIPLRLHHAELNQNDNSIRFEMLSEAPKNGVYRQVAVFAECIDAPSSQTKNLQLKKTNEKSSEDGKASKQVKTKY